MTHRLNAPIAGSLVLLIAATFLSGCSSPSVADSSFAGARPAIHESAPPPVALGEPASTAERSLVSLAAGSYVVQRPSEWADFASSFHLLDERPGSIWATEKGVTSPQPIVIALAERTVLTSLLFDSLSAEMQFGGCSAKDITVEMSDESAETGFRRIASVSLADRANGQRFAVEAEVPGRWVRLVVENNHGSNVVTELGEFRAYGAQLTHTSMPDIDGAYDTAYTGALWLHREGDAVFGRYDARGGRFEGGVDGRVVAITWHENTAGGESGRGIMVFAPDGRRFVAMWWGPHDSVDAYGRLVVGTRTGDDENAGKRIRLAELLALELERSNQARVYGVSFATDSDAIEPASRPTLDEIAAALATAPERTVTIEGHTDALSTPAHNQALSELRAAAVKAYLVAAGIAANRLSTVGYGASRPVADNDSELGRAQNRRVELTTVTSGM